VRKGGKGKRDGCVTHPFHFEGEKKVIHLDANLLRVCPPARERKKKGRKGKEKEGPAASSCARSGFYHPSREGGRKEKKIKREKGEEEGGRRKAPAAVQRATVACSVAGEEKGG